MSYVKQNFSGGQVLTATNLNHMEEGIAAAGTVKSVNGILPDESGNISSTIVKQFFFIDGSILVPGVTNYYGTETMEEIVNMLRNSTVTHSISILRLCMQADGSVITRKYTGFETLQDDNLNYIGAKLFYGDDLCPVILDIPSNKIIFDPDWVAPPATVKTINNVTPDENGDITIIEPYKYVFINSPLGFMAPYSVDELYAYCTDASAFNKNSFIHRVYNPLNPTQPTYEYMCTEVQSTSTQIKLLFDDKVAPVIIDKTANTITLDPDWTAPAAAVKTINGMTPDENGNVVFDKPFSFIIEHSTSVDYPQFNYIKCLNKTLAEIRQAFAQHKKHAIVGRLNLYNADLDKDDYRELKQYSIDYNGKDGGFRYILHFDDDIPNYICDINADTITTDPEWVAPLASVKSFNGILPDENGNIVSDTAFREDMLISGGRVMARKTASEISNAILLPTKAPVFAVSIMEGDGISPRYIATKFEKRRIGEIGPDSYNVDVLHFDDKIAPIIIDPIHNTITIDSDWTAPVNAFVTEDRVNELIAEAFTAISNAEEVGF